MFCSPRCLTALLALSFLAAPNPGSAQTVNCAGVPAWVATTTYNAGNQVTYQGGLYQAQVTTTNVPPNYCSTCGWWQAQGSCGSASTCAAAPSVPAGLSSPSQTSSSITLTWAAASAGSACAVSYDVYQNGAKLVNTAATSTTLTGLAAGTVYSYSVAAVDQAGSSARSGAISVATSGAGPRKVACIGDSITYGIGTSDAATRSYPAVLQQLLGSGYSVRNFGVSGTTLLKQGDFSYWGTSEFTDSQNWSPDIVVIMLGTNDSKSQNWQYQASFVSDYEQMINTYRNLPAHPVVYLNTSPSVFGGGLAGITQAVVHDQVLPKILQAAVAMNCPVIDVNTATSGVYWDFPDSVHPNDMGAHVVANAVYYGLLSSRVDLTSAFNEDAFSHDSARGDGSYDAPSGGASYSADLASSASSFHNVNFRLGPLGDGRSNSIRCAGQSIALPGQPCVALWLLGSATYGDHTGAFQITYSDGSSASVSVTERDWCSADTTGQNVVETLAHRHVGGGDQTLNNYLFAYELPVDPSRAVASVQLPSEGNMHVLALTLVPYLGAVPAPAVRLSTGFEAGQLQPTWLDAIGSGSQVTGYYSSINPECSPRSETAHSGTAALMYSGTANGGVTNCYYKVFQVNIPVTSGTVLDYWIYPQQDNGRFVAVDFHCTDGTTLRDSGAVDQSGFSLHPYFGHGAAIPINAWSEVRSEVGLWMVGKTIDELWVAYDRAGGLGQYRGYLDDLSITK